ncbi:cytochrome P450 [Gymnopus androsaceus JB14]|uniref:Cytochrome P450 n=1 Tax=Gymnopus androsaceus JB14 TaxID=1447944 RepID=A0A6A4H8N1_9AGAR|nr:cytochrome P450 [Gymnopus androsaceus JB14]
MSSQIPQPPGYPFVGNIFSLNNDVPAHGFHELAQQYGEIYQLNLIGRQVIFVSSYALVNELSDDSRFRKSVGFNDESSWGIAHRLLVPAFGYEGDLRADAIQMERPSNWTLLSIRPMISLESHWIPIALCSMSYRLGSFESVSFSVARVNASSNGKSGLSATICSYDGGLSPRMQQQSEPSLDLAAISNRHKWKVSGGYQDDEKHSKSIVILEDRKANLIDRKDVLDVMLHGRDPRTGTQLSDEGIIDNVSQFLAITSFDLQIRTGHETTSGTMSFALYYLLKYPETMTRLQSEVDSILGDQPAQLCDLTRMEYLNAVIRETMRLQPTAAIRAVYPLEDTFIGADGKYFVQKNAPIALQMWDLHRDVSVWGLDAEEFKPERMLRGNFESFPTNAWQPFGFGMRSCIGRAFAWQEMCLVLSSVVQRFDLALADSSYELQITQAITIKPKGFYIVARRRSK